MHTCSFSIFSSPRRKLSLISCLWNHTWYISFELHCVFPHFSNIMIQRHGNIQCHAFPILFPWLPFTYHVLATPTLDADQSTNQNIESAYKVLLMIDDWKIKYLASKLRRIESSSCHTLFSPNNRLSYWKLKIHSRASLWTDSPNTDPNNFKLHIVYYRLPVPVWCLYNLITKNVWM